MVVHMLWHDMLDLSPSSFFSGMSRVAFKTFLQSGKSGSDTNPCFLIQICLIEFTLL